MFYDPPFYDHGSKCRPPLIQPHPTIWNLRAGLNELPFITFYVRLSEQV